MCRDTVIVCVGIQYIVCVGIQCIVCVGIQYIVCVGIQYIVCVEIHVHMWYMPSVCSIVCSLKLCVITV